MRALITLTLGLFLTGCASVPLAPTKPDVSRVKPSRAALSFDDPLAVFAPVFPSYRWFAKQQFETEPEYRQRLAQTGIEGREVTFLIPPELCEVTAFPDQGTYIITTQDRLTASRRDPSETKWAITIASVSDGATPATQVNRFGVSREVQQFSGKKYMVRLEGFERLPLVLKWKEEPDTGLIRFGLPVKSLEPAFRALLKEKKVGLAVRGKIGNLASSVQSFEGYSARANETVSNSTDLLVLPFLIEDAYIYDTASQATIMHWSSKP